MTSPDCQGLATNDLLEFDRKHLWHPYASLTDPPTALPVIRADGVRLQLADGQWRIDGMSSWWAAIHGYNHPSLNRAIHEQMGEMAHVMFGGLTHRAAVELGKALVALAPPGLDRVFFCDSGSVAVEVAMKMALQYHRARGDEKRSRFLSVRGGYHGDTWHAMSVCDPVTGMHRLFGTALPQQLFAPRPCCRFGEAWRDEDVAPLAELAKTHREEICGIILEPVVQGAGGMHFYHPEYLRRVRRICDDEGLLLLCDEIATGFGRTGRMFACEHASISPDILCLGKALTGGYLSLAATLCTEDVARNIGSAPPGLFMHGPTFMANPLACRVARASIEELLRRPWREEVATIEAILRQELHDAITLPQVVDVRMLGAIGVIETRQPVDHRVIAPVLREHGVWLRPFGRLVYTMPPYIIRQDELRAVCAAMLACVKTLSATNLRTAAVTTKGAITA